MEMTYTALFNRCMDDNNYPAFMSIQSEMDKDLKKSQEDMAVIRKEQSYYDFDCVKFYELEIEMYKRLIEFNEKIIVLKKFYSAPAVKLRGAVETPLKLAD